MMIGGENLLGNQNLPFCVSLGEYRAPANTIIAQHINLSGALHGLFTM